MKKISFILILGLIIVSCKNKNDQLTIKEVTHIYADSLSHRYATAKFVITDDSSIVTKIGENELRISVENAYREYLMEPDSLLQVISRYLTSTSDAFSISDKVDIDRIVPIIRPVEYLDYFKGSVSKDAKPGDSVGVYEKYNDQLLIFYAEDTKNNISYLTQDELKKLSVNKDSLRSIAIRNLERFLPDIQRQGDDGVFMLTAGGNYETSIILLNDILNKENIPVDGDLIIAIPNRDLLLVTGSNNKTGIEKVRKTAANFFATGDHNVSEFLYKWDGIKFSK